MVTPSKPDMRSMLNVRRQRGRLCIVGGSVSEEDEDGRIGS